MIDIVLYSLIVIIIAVLIVPTIVYQCIKWGVVAWFKGKEFVLKHKKPDLRNFNDSHNSNQE